ncbi:5-carboxymethyl-2-hydroxymuconate isomerase [Hahella sp. CCB-MM4]|uniref:5-carboxymethyl-2-hydroxymuconate Delta-isomerase n=1 Tax=Hahella sp. (strain CCB-MM4) TaxID=1926491 RepID=UPI000B9B9900|nr:5-carboxymethyl-2-hydroxymuconate Delta-isomerase [Hahella sp. CCB-MM4]OZG75016.1 5-carboxymethyl-2-hydroxymuconate isomerase [Hahella sp. CCB-MM4]
MPHFVMDCSEDVLDLHYEEEILQQIHSVVNGTGLFDEGDIKIRVNPYAKFSVGNRRESFIHVFSHILEGRSTEQKSDLSKALVDKLVSMFPEIPNIAVNVYEFEKATYCNRAML